MKASIKSLPDNGSAWLAILTLLALMTSAAISVRQAQHDQDKGDWRIHPEYRLTGMRYYLRKHGQNRFSDILSEIEAVAHFDVL